MLPDLGMVPNDYLSQFDKNLRKYKKAAKRLKGWDVTLDPVESLPVAEYDTVSMAVGNWGEKLLNPDAIRERIKKECKHKVYFEINDSAGKFSHKDLQTGILPGSNYSSSPVLDDISLHGTHVGGIVGAKDFGVAWELLEAGLALMKPVKSLGDQGNASYKDLAAGIKTEDAFRDSMRDKGYLVLVNCSWGGGTAQEPGLKKALQDSIAKGSIYFFSSGNGGKRGVIFPSNMDETVSVGAIDQRQNRAVFSDYGPELDIMAPGVNIVSTYRGDTYASLNGTSMANPFVTGLAGIALSRWGEALNSKEKLLTYLGKIAKDLGAPGKDEMYGYGLAFAQSILDTEPQGQPDEPDDEPTPDPITSTVGLRLVGMTSRFRNQTTKASGTLFIEEVDIHAAGFGDEMDVYNTAKVHAESFFKNNMIVFVNPEATTYDAFWAVGRFLEVLSRNKNYDIKVEKLVGYDAAGNRFIARDFGTNRSLEARCE